MILLLVSVIQPITGYRDTNSYKKGANKQFKHQIHLLPVARLSDRRQVIIPYKIKSVWQF
ncbi:hypothetical protein CTI32_14540 (plasmid) [Enterococcus faecium]|nr:hypothetical protein CTI32_14540 [Enterococcus faecium]